MERTKFKEKDFAAKSAGLMKFKAEDKLRRGEQVANFMLKSRKKCLISSKRDIFGNLRRREKLVSHMISGFQGRGGPANHNLSNNIEEYQEESK